MNSLKIYIFKMKTKQEYFKIMILIGHKPDDI